MNNAHNVEIKWSHKLHSCTHVEIYDFFAFPLVKTSNPLRLRIVALLLVKDDGDLLLMFKPWCATVKYCSRWERFRLYLEFVSHTYALENYDYGFID